MNHLELIMFSRSQRPCADFLPGFSGPWSGSHLNPRHQGHFIPPDDLWPKPREPNPPPPPPPPPPHQSHSLPASLQHLSVNTLQIAFRFEFPTSAAIFWPPLISASRIEILSPSLHEELVKQKKQEINVPASRLHTALDGIKVE